MYMKKDIMIYKNIKLLFGLTVIILLFSCTATKEIITEVKTQYKVIFATNNDGIYLYNYADNQSKKVCDIKKIFLPNSLKQINDSLIIVGENNTPKSSENRDFVFYKINIKSGEYSKYKTVSCIKIKDTETSVRSIYFSQSGNITSQKDTVFDCDKFSLRIKGIQFCNIGDYVLEKDPKKVFSQRGSLYLKDTEGEKLILEYTGNYTRRISSGYFTPSLSLDGKKIAYKYEAGMLNPNSGIYEVEIETGSQNVLSDDAGFFKPNYSNDGEYLLLGKNKKLSEDKAWIEDFFIYKIKSSYDIKIGEGNNYIWIY